MWRYQSCCGCCPLKTGCIVLGSLGIAVDLLFLLSGPTIFRLIVGLIDVMLIIGAVKKNRICLVPWMIYETLFNILIWIVVGLCLFSPSLAEKWSSIYREEGDFNKYHPHGIAITLALFAVAQAFIIKVVVDHFRELGEGGHPGQTHQLNAVNLNANQAVMYPVFPPAPLPANYSG